MSSPTGETAEANEWRDDPSADERWNAGLDYGQTQLCHVLGVDPQSVSWDAATETLDGDVRSVIGNILTARFGDNWREAATPAQGSVGGADQRELLAQILWENENSIRLQRSWIDAKAYVEREPKSFIVTTIRDAYKMADHILARLTAPGGGGSGTAAAAAPDQTPPRGDVTVEGPTLGEVSDLAEELFYADPEHFPNLWINTSDTNVERYGAMARAAIAILSRQSAGAEPAKPSAPVLTPDRKLTIAREAAVERLRTLAKKAKGEEWFIEHAATDDGLSRIDDGCQDGMFPITGEAHEIDFAAECVKFCREFVLAEALTPSGGQVGVPVEGVARAELEARIAAGVEPSDPCDCKIGDCKKSRMYCLEDRKRGYNKPLSARPTATEG